MTQVEIILVLEKIKKVTSELALIKTQTPSVSNALEEIAATESSIESQAEKCQDDVEQAFEEMISVLQTCKQAMKDEATAYYSSLIGVFDQQKERLKDIRSKIELVVTSVDATLQDNDQNFLVRLESSFESISNLQKKFQAASLTVAKPQLIAIIVMQTDHDIDMLSQYMKKSFFFNAYNLADAKMCSVDITDAKLCIGHQMLFTITFQYLSGNTCIGENEIDVNLLQIQDNHSIKGKLELPSQGHIKVTLTPERRGLHQLNVKVNGAHIKNSPFTVTVYAPPNLLLQPVAIVSGLKRPASLVYSQAEDKVIAATEANEGSIIKVNSQFQLIQSESRILYHVTEITQGEDLNIFYATTSDNQLHKLSSNWGIIKTVGRLGKRNAEFDYPNGLKMNKKRELYVCDTGNHRMQIFDINLNFKQSFGEYGIENGQFKSPADIDFDSSSNIYVTEQDNQRIQVFTCAKCHIRNITQGGTNSMFLPLSFLIHGENVYVTDYDNHKVWVLTTSGEVIATFGEGHLRNPEGITMDKAGFVYVTSHHSKIVVF